MAQLRNQLTDPNDDVNSIEVSPDGSLLAAASSDTNTYTYDTQNWQLTNTLSDQRRVVDATWSPATPHLITLERFRRLSGRANIWETDTWQFTDVLANKDDPGLQEPLDATWSPDGRFFLIANGALTEGEGKVHIWNTALEPPQNWQLVRTLGDFVIKSSRKRTRTEFVHHLDFATDRRWLALTERNDSAVIIFNTASTNQNKWEQKTILRDAERPHQTQFSHGSIQLAVTDTGDNQLHIYDATTWKRLDTINLPEITPGPLAWSPTDEFLAIGSLQPPHKVVILETTNWTQVDETIQNHGDTINDLVWTRDGGTLVTASNDNTVAIWTPQVGTSLAQLRQIPRTANLPDILGGTSLPHAALFAGIGSAATLLLTES